MAPYGTMKETEGLVFSTADVASHWQECISYPPQTLQIVNGPWRVEKILRVLQYMLARDNLTLEIDIDRNRKIYEWDQINDM